MSNYDNTNRGQIWPNDKKDTDKHPDFKGSIDVEGVEYWVSAWKRRPDANPKSPSLSFSIQPKQQQSSQPDSQPQGQGASVNNDFDDDIPFACVDWC